MKKMSYYSSSESWIEFYSKGLEKLFKQSFRKFIGHLVGFQAKRKKWIRNK